MVADEWLQCVTACQVGWLAIAYIWMAIAYMEPGG